MITLKQAYEIAQAGIPEGCILGRMCELPDCWTYLYRDKDNGEEDDISPTAISKTNGTEYVFFPPDYSREYLSKAEYVLLSELEKLMPPEDFELMKKYREQDEREDAEWRKNHDRST